MDRLGLEEGEVIQHSMITKSIERAQKKVEENNFGIRKKLLEYDDVMNSQREVIYTKRRHALFGERLSLDLVNMMSELSDSIASSYDDFKDFGEFKLELIRIFQIDSPVDEAEFMKMSSNELADKIFEAAGSHYRQKNEVLRERVLPVIKNVYDTQGQTIENIVVPFSDGIKQVQVLVNLKEAVETEGRELLRAFERTITLAMIDDAWKDHLREMDELKTSVQNAVYEQKDPLLIYKFESFNLFKGMLGETNKEVLSFLYKAIIPVKDPSNVKEGHAPQRTDMSNLKTQHDNIPVAAVGNPATQGQEARAQKPKPQPVRAEQKVGRNDPCPCGSGKKYKNCHGAG
jgi:preprotein translocase subunit SecA